MMGKDSESATPLLEPQLPPQAVTYSTRFGRRALLILVLFNICWTFTLLYLTASFSANCKSISVPSPLLHAIDQRLEPRTMSGRIHDDGSIFRQGPSEQVDEAWARVALDGFELFNVTEADIIASGKDPTTRVRWDPPVDSYPAQVEFAHQIHCLDVVRKEIWGEHYFGNISIAADDAAIASGEYDPNSQDGYYHYGDGGETTYTLKGQRRMHRQHTMHCLHMILQSLMCNLDLGIVTHDWTPGNPNFEPSPPARPFADFSTNKMCRNFNAASEWVRKNAVRNGDRIFSRLPPPPSVRVAERNDSYWP
ncbi:hypothetical protein B0T14DRAFT_589252 [Immersiella caudata]|uniref:Uncharacterized protein n=1 Tax=Immersiella caudata TaxID=314043 RepID=A0AA39WK71_9PEZI|nr:hypothetical protein B0T14DRAFT_589252 [Immersiella caudata]